MASSPLPPCRLGVNIDHVATLRNARGGLHPDPLRAAQTAERAGADGITAHLREDRRHIRDEDIERLIDGIEAPLNLEMAATAEMIEIASRVKPHAACLVPEKREELTTEGGLDVVRGKERIADAVARLTDAGIRVSLFIEPSEEQLDAARVCQAPVVEFHTGAYCNAAVEPNPDPEKAAEELRRIRSAARYAASIGIECHAGHGLDFATVSPIAGIGEIVELNIGHFLIGEAVFLGLDESIRHMKRLIEAARRQAESS